MRLHRSVHDVVLYVGSLLFALIVAFAASIHLYREWGRVAMGPYAAGAVAASVLAVRAGAARARVWLAVFVFVGAALVPLGLEVAWRVRTSPGRHAQSEAIVTEEAAEALVHGKDPYATTYLHGPLADRPLGTKTHFPYLPGMLVFGLPRALAGHRSVADARVWFALTTLALTGASLALWRTSAEAKLHAVQWLVVLPTGALLMATGGDDLPVLALLLFALVLAQRDRPVAGGIALGVAAATKQTAWVLVPFLLIAAMANGRPAATKLAASTAAVVLPVIAAALAWNPGAFWEDAVRFPLGLGKQRTPAATPTIGSLIVHTFPEAKTGLTVALIGAVGILVLYLLVRRPPRSVAQAAAWAAGVFTVGYVFAPAARFGYVVYPIDLLVWASALGYRLSPRRSGR